MATTDWYPTYATEKAAPEPQKRVRGGDIVVIYWRTTAAGNAVTAVAMPAIEAQAAISRFPWEWSADASTWAAFPDGYSNAGQSPGGIGRLAGASTTAN